MLGEETIDSFDEFDVHSIHGTPDLMGVAHRHQGIELNFVERGAMRYLFAGETVTISAGRLAVFWATFPHRVVDRIDEPCFYYFHIPLVRFLEWRLPAALTSTVLQGKIAIDTQIDNEPADRVLLPRWHRDIGDPTDTNLRIFFLEVEARLLRMVCAEPDGNLAPLRGRTGEVDKVAQMAAYIAAKYTEEIDVDDIAAHVNLHPKYAISLFRRRLGVTTIEYLTQHRVAHAQRLLTTTSMSIVDVGFISGFGSVSRFYEVFKRATGQSPGDFRRKIVNVE